MDKQMTAAAFAAKAETALKEGWGYIWGMSGQVWTREAQEEAERIQTVRWGSQWIGKRVCDCSGLIVWALKTEGIDVYHGSNTMWQKECAAKGRLKDGQRTDGERLKRGTVLFLTDDLGSRHHVGIYMGGGRVIEAKGTRDGVTVSGTEGWQEWGELKQVDYRDEGVCESMRTMKRGCAGEDVKQLQERLNALGYDCGSADGKYGQMTELAVMYFQENEGIRQDGMAGEETMRALQAAEDRKVKNAAQATEQAERTVAELLREAMELLKNALAALPE